MHAIDQAVQHMGEVQVAIGELFSYPGPRGFLGRNDLDPMLLVEAHDRGHDDRCAIGERDKADFRSEEHTSELQSLMRISYAVFCLKKKKTTKEQDVR